jgi:hypothetical protein
VQEEAPELGERVRREQHQRQVEGAQDEESRRLRDLWEGKKRKRATGRDDGVDAGNVDGASHGRFQMGALGQSRAKAARAGRSGALRVTWAAASAGNVRSEWRKSTRIIDRISQRSNRQDQSAEAGGRR